MATFFPAFFSNSAILRVVWLFPEPVLTAHTAITGFLLSRAVSSGPKRVKDALQERQRLALCITSRCETSLYAKTTSFTWNFFINSASLDSGKIGMPLG